MIITIAWSLNQWGLMENIVSQLPQDNVEASFLRSVLAVHNEKYEESAKVTSILIFYYNI